MDTTADATVSPIGQRDPRRRAVELYQTTDLTVPEIAAQVGVSKESVYRWLRKEGVAVGSTANNIAGGQAGEHLRDLGREVVEVRRELAMLVGNVRRLEGLIEALIGLKAQGV
jgi:transposase-like protein